MKCQRAEELFSDFHEGALTPPLERELALHIDGCGPCRELYRTFQEVTGALAALPVPDPPAALADGLAALAPARPPRSFAAASPRKLAAASWLAVAAMLAMMMVLRPPELTTDVSRHAGRTARHVYTFAMRSYHRAEVWLEDLNVLRMTVGVAFEDRIDQINEQLRDLADAGRRTPEDDEQSRDRRRFDESPAAAGLEASPSRSLS